MALLNTIIKLTPYTFSNNFWKLHSSCTQVDFHAYYPWDNISGTHFWHPAWVKIFFEKHPYGNISDTLCEFGNKMEFSSWGYATFCAIFGWYLDLEKSFTLENFLIKKSSLMQPTGSTSFDTPQQQATSESISPTLGEFKHHPSFHSNTPHTNLWINIVENEHTSHAQISTTDGAETQ